MIKRRGCGYIVGQAIGLCLMALFLAIVYGALLIIAAAAIHIGWNLVP